jgi:hypothetical protein
VSNGLKSKMMKFGFLMATRSYLNVDQLESYQAKADSVEF